ncbi:18125_t:CDS:2, partial [Funneliformis geosporum]
WCTFMFGRRSVIQDPPVIKSGDHRLKYKSVQEIIDLFSTVSNKINKIYKYPVNDMTGTYQRSMIRKVKSTSKSTYFSIPELYEPTSMHSLFNDDTFGKEKSFNIDNDRFPHFSFSTEDIEQFNTLKWARNESANQIESRKRIAGPITTFTSLITKLADIAITL